MAGWLVRLGREGEGLEWFMGCHSGEVDKADGQTAGLNYFLILL